MGIDAQTTSKTFPKGRLLRAKGENALSMLIATAKTWAEAQHLGPFFAVTYPTPTTAEITLLPVADPLILTVTKSAISAGFRSSNGGPGFHVLVITLLDHIAKTHAMSWQWQASDGTQLDETGYATHRDFAVLQTAMTGFMTTLATIAARDIKDGSLCLPMDLQGARPGTIGPLGPLPDDWGQQVQQADTTTLQTLGAGFFPCWTQPHDPQFWQSLLRAMLWQIAEWRPTLTDRDDRIHRQITHALKMAQQTTPLPPDLQRAIQDYTAARLDDGPPAQDGIGYRKNLLHWALYPSWSLRLPGYVSFADNEGSASFDHPGFWLGTRSMTSTCNPAAITPFHPPSPAPITRCRAA